MKTSMPNLCHKLIHSVILDVSRAHKNAPGKKPIRVWLIFGGCFGNLPAQWETLGNRPGR